MRLSPVLWASRAAFVASLLMGCRGTDGPISVEETSPDLEGSARPLAPGEVETVLELTPRIDRLEGIAIDHRGNLFLGNDRLEGDIRFSEILQISPEGVTTVFAILDPATDLINGGVAGLAVSPQGDLYAALPTLNSATHGVWRIGKGGMAVRLPSRRQHRPGPGRPDPDPARRESRGARGRRHGVRAAPDRRPGRRCPRRSPCGDRRGEHLGTAPLVRIDPRTGAITPSTTELGAFDFPTSLAFGAGRRDRKSVYVVNSRLFPEDPAWMPAPGVVRVGVGVAGAPTH